jgi:hypothetical protein
MIILPGLGEGPGLQDFIPNRESGEYLLSLVIVIFVRGRQQEEGGRKISDHPLWHNTTNSQSTTPVIFYDFLAIIIIINLNQDICHIPSNVTEHKHSIVMLMYLVIEDFSKESLKHCSCSAYPTHLPSMGCAPHRISPAILHCARQIILLLKYLTVAS